VTENVCKKFEKLFKYYVGPRAFFLVEQISTISICLVEGIIARKKQLSPFPLEQLIPSLFAAMCAQCAARRHCSNRTSDDDDDDNNKKLLLLQGGATEVCSDGFSEVSSKGFSSVDGEIQISCSKSFRVREL
jgi:hypothetical protein